MIENELFSRLKIPNLNKMDLLVIFVLTILSLTHSKVVHLSCKHIRAFVDGHNARRLLLAEGKIPGHPTAFEMKKLVWDDELQAKAASWAAKQARGHHNRHNPSTSVPSGRFSTSENLYWYSTTDPHYKLDPEIALNSWFNEHKNFTFGPLNQGHFSSGRSDVGHYTQMVWSDSIYVGCAIYKKSKNRWQHFYVVCNYAPQGNFLGSQPYKTASKANGRTSNRTSDRATSKDSGSVKLQCDHKDCKYPYGEKCK